jgi:hypothetical protein
MRILSERTMAEEIFKRWRMGVIICSECGEKCKSVVEFMENEYKESEVCLCESCLERALGMLRDSP